ncbi:mitochondrial ATP-independent inner membrane protease subunit 1a-like isoform X1 [Apium graveolens]|uniref:mitochondrial ATP-independent inner membrane protease subunit 1a-like isoform X1 n=1 Tax=Apium graveolens TaxID=4045 RepID=UPI003D7AEC3C
MNTTLWTYIVKEAFDKTLVLAKFFCTLHLTNTYLLTPAYVTGSSMIPTFEITGGFVLAEKISTRFSKVGKGDIVLIRSPEDPRKIVTKRVVGMEGDSVSWIVTVVALWSRLLFLKGMFGLREITSTCLEIQEHLALFLTG